MVNNVGCRGWNDTLGNGSSLLRWRTLVMGPNGSLTGSVTKEWR